MPTGTLPVIGCRFLRNVLLKGWPGSIDSWQRRQPRTSRRNRKRWRCRLFASRASSASGVTVPRSSRVTAGGARRAGSRTRTTSSARTSSDDQGALHSGGRPLRPSLGRGEDGWHFSWVLRSMERVAQFVLQLLVCLELVASGYQAIISSSPWFLADTCSVPECCMDCRTWTPLGRHLKKMLRIQYTA